MNNSTENGFITFLKLHKMKFVLALVILLLMVNSFVIWNQFSNDNNSNPPDTDTVSDQNEYDELAPFREAAEIANAEYKKEMEAREADKELIADGQNKIRELESEINRLIDELKAKEVELDLATPPILDIKKIIGMYEDYGELVTLTYTYEVTVQAENKGNIFTNKNLLYLIPGTLKMGVNFDQVKDGIKVDEENKIVTVIIPEAYFISNEINESGVERYDISRAFFSKVEDKDYLNVAEKAKETAQKQVTDNDMLIYAQKLAGLQFIGLYEPLTSKSGYEIVVEYE
jgi:hypothetical protein